MKKIVFEPIKASTAFKLLENDEPVYVECFDSMEKIEHSARFDDIVDSVVAIVGDLVKESPFYIRKEG